MDEKLPENFIKIGERTFNPNYEVNKYNYYEILNILKGNKSNYYV